MTNNLIFGGWFQHGKQVVGIQPIKKLQNLHGKKPYSIVVGENKEHPFCFLEVGVTRILVGFIDENKREYLSYDWIRESNGKLFLNTGAYFEYGVNKHGDDEISVLTEYVFTVEGQLKIITSDNRTNQREVLTAKNKVDVSGLWEDYPEFGCYDNLIKIERLPKDLGM